MRLDTWKLLSRENEETEDWGTRLGMPVLIYPGRGWMSKHGDESWGVITSQDELSGVRVHVSHTSESDAGAKGDEHTGVMVEHNAVTGSWVTPTRSRVGVMGLTLG